MKQVIDFRKYSDIIGDINERKVNKKMETTEKPVRLKKDGTPRKGGSGRTKGAVSLVTVRLSELTAMFSQEDLIVVGRKFLEKKNAKPTEVLPKITEPTQSEGITVTKFEEAPPAPATA